MSPVQRVTDFLSEVATPCDGGMQPVSPYYSAIEGTAAKIPSSYRMGVKGNTLTINTVVYMMT